VDSSCAVNEGLPEFLSAAIMDNELTYAGHKFYHDNANIVHFSFDRTVDLFTFNRLLGDSKLSILI
jgi:hypothetical protein